VEKAGRAPAKHGSFTAARGVESMDRRLQPLGRSIAPGRRLLWCGLLCLAGNLGCNALTRRTDPQPHRDARAFSLRGAEALERQRYEDAEALFSEALHFSQTDERAHWGYAQTLLLQKRLDEAASHMARAVELSGNNPAYLVDLGRIHLERGDVEMAVQCARSAIVKDHRSSGAWRLMGDGARVQRRWEESLEHYQRALISQPDNPPVQLSVSELYLQLGRPRRSLATLDHMVDLHPDAIANPELLLQRGLALAALGRQSEAIAILDRVSDQLPLDRTDRHLQLAEAQVRLGELVAARRTLGRLLQEFPGNESATRLLSTLDLRFEHLAMPLVPSEEVPSEEMLVR